MDKKIEISIIIPVKNGASTITKCLQGIKNQSLFYKSEIIIIDSGSTDDTLDLIKKYPVRLYQINPKTFNHGATRNYGVSLAAGEFIVLTVQDAIPLNKLWLENLMKPFNDKTLSAVCGQQIVPHHKDKNPHEWFRPISQPQIKTYKFKPEEFRKLQPEQQLFYCRWDNVTTAYRKVVLKALPFTNVMFGEDMIWARDALSQGLKIAYSPFSQVEHYHHHSPNFTFRRTLVVSLFKYKTFKVAPSQGNILKKLMFILYRNLKWKVNPKWISFNWKMSLQSHRAKRLIISAIKNKNLNKIEQEFIGNLPIGNQK